MTATSSVVPHVWDHGVYFHEGDGDLAERVGWFVGEALDAGDIVIVAATWEHVAGFSSLLSASGRDPAAARADGSMIVIDADRVAEQLLVDGALDVDRFDEMAAGVVRHAVALAAARGCGVRVYGEIVGCLWEGGHVAAAVELEGVWNELARELSFALLCGYPAGLVSDDAAADALLAVCRLHGHVGGSLPVDARRREASVTATTRTFPPEPDAVRRARHFVIETLRGAGRLEFLGDASLVVTELATNAIVHANTDFTISVVVTGMRGETLRLSVRDGSAAEPVLDLSAAGESSRRGLQLVAALARQWASVPLSDGKVVWAELTC